MFVITLNSGKSFEANVVDERYDTGRNESPSYSLILRVTDAQEELDYYTNLLTEPDALKQITITDELGANSIFNNYDIVSTIGRNLVPGGSNIQIVLLREATE